MIEYWDIGVPIPSFISNYADMSCKALRVKPESLEWLQIHYGLSPSFVEPVVNISKWAKPGDVFYQTRDQDSKIIKIGQFFMLTRFFDLTGVMS